VEKKFFRPEKNLSMSEKNRKKRQKCAQKAKKGSSKPRFLENFSENFRETAQNKEGCHADSLPFKIYFGEIYASSAAPSA
jgi:hypothetical protein